MKLDTPLPGGTRRSLTLLLPFLIAVTAVGQDSRPTSAPSPATTSLALHAEAGKEIAFAISSSKNSHLVLETPTGPRSWFSHFSRIVKAIDRYEEVSEKRCAGTRTYLWDRSTKNGEVTDRPRNGASFRFSVEGRNVRAETTDGTCRLEQDLRTELMNVESLGIWVKLPAKAHLGDTFEVDLITLAPLLFDLDEPAKTASAWLTLTAVDSESGIATLGGDVRLRFVQRMGDTTSEVFMRVACVLSVNTKDRAIQSIQCWGDADYVGSATTGARAEGHLKLRSYLELGVGEDAVASVEDTEIDYRDTDRAPRGLAMSFKLPSYWSDTGPRHGNDSKKGWTYKTAVDGPESLRMLWVTAALTEDAPAEMKALLGKIPNASPPRPVETGVGPGQTVEISNAETEMIVDLVPWRNRLMTFQMEFRTASRKEVLRDLELVRRSLLILEETGKGVTVHGAWATGKPGLPADGHPGVLVGRWSPEDGAYVMTLRKDGSWTSEGEMLYGTEEHTVREGGTWHVHKGALQLSTKESNTPMPSQKAPYTEILRLVSVDESELEYECPGAGCVNRLIRAFPLPTSRPTSTEK